MLALRRKMTTKKIPDERPQDSEQAFLKFNDFRISVMSYNLNPLYLPTSSVKSVIYTGGGGEKRHC